MTRQRLTVLGSSGPGSSGAGTRHHRRSVSRRAPPRARASMPLEAGSFLSGCAAAGRRGSDTRRRRPPPGRGSSPAHHEVGPPGPIGNVPAPGRPAAPTCTPRAAHAGSRHWRPFPRRTLRRGPSPARRCGLGTAPCRGRSGPQGPAPGRGGVEGSQGEASPLSPTSREVGGHGGEAPPSRQELTTSTKRPRALRDEVGPSDSPFCGPKVRGPPRGVATSHHTEHAELAGSTLQASQAEEPFCPPRRVAGHPGRRAPAPEGPSKPRPPSRVAVPGAPR